MKEVEVKQIFWDCLGLKLLSVQSADPPIPLHLLACGTVSRGIPQSTAPFMSSRHLASLVKSIIVKLLPGKKGPLCGEGVLIRAVRRPKGGAIPSWTKEETSAIATEV